MHKSGPILLQAEVEFYGQIRFLSLILGAKKYSIHLINIAFRGLVAQKHSIPIAEQTNLLKKILKEWMLVLIESKQWDRIDRPEKIFFFSMICPGSYSNPYSRQECIKVQKKTNKTSQPNLAH